MSDYSFEDFQRVQQVNVAGVFLGLKHVLPAMIRQKSGSIVITSSVAGLKGTAGIIGYNASKHAVIGMMRCAAVECAKYNARVNCVNPGPVEGRMMDSIDIARSGNKETSHLQRAAAIPARRYGKPEEIASLVSFLASDAAAYCNGGIFTVDGALTAG